MSIADKLVYLSGTKNLLAEAINSYREVIDEDTPFRQYASFIDDIVFDAKGGLKSIFTDEAGFLWGDLPYYQDPAGTTEATWGDPVGLIPDASGNGADFTQATVTARPVLREVDGIASLEFDGTDDLVAATLPAITGGTLVIAGTNGIWIDDDYNFAGGTFEIGPTSYTNSPTGILPLIGDLIVGGTFVIDRQLTSDERAKVVRKMKSMGSPGLFRLGPELVVNGGPDFENTDGWGSAGLADVFTAEGELRVKNTGLYFGQAVFEALGTQSGRYQIELEGRKVSASGQAWALLGQTGDNARFGTYSLPTSTIGVYRRERVAVVHEGNNLTLRLQVNNSSVENEAALRFLSIRKLELVP